MGQTEVLDYLKRNGECTVDDISKKLGISDRNIRKSLEKLCEHGKADFDFKSIEISISFKKPCKVWRLKK